MNSRDCDWRVQQDPTCPDSQYFFIFYLVTLAISSLNLFLVVFILVYRVSSLSLLTSTTGTTKKINKRASGVW
jgi:hypothetical protein